MRLLLLVYPSISASNFNNLVFYRSYAMESEENDKVMVLPTLIPLRLQRYLSLQFLIFARSWAVLSDHTGLTQSV